MIYGGGMLEMGITMSFAQLVMDNEIIAMTRRVLEGIPVNDETLAVDVIKSVGARGHFLAEEHTVRHMKTCQSQPELMDRRMRQFWQERGAKDYAEACAEKARYILEHHQPDPVSDVAAKTMRSLIEEREDELGVKGHHAM